MCVILENAATACLSFPTCKMKTIIIVLKALFRIKCDSPYKALSMMHNNKKKFAVVIKIRKVTYHRDDSESGD